MYRLVGLCIFLTVGVAHGAEQLRVTATHELDAARPAETIAVPWTAVTDALPGASPQKLEIKDADGHVLPYQITHVARDPSGAGIANGELLFQHDFAKGEKSGSFTIEKSEHAAKAFPSPVFARPVPERYDDFAWENDRLAYRIYGPALAAPAAPGSNKEVLVSSGIDVWFKRVPYPVIDRWYRKGRYHEDEGEGLDMYGVGNTRGLSGTGIWDGSRLRVGRNYAQWKILENGPIRVEFEVAYDTWDGGGVDVTEVKRFTLDAGSQFCRVESTFSFTGRAALTAAVGLNRHPNDREREASAQTVTLTSAGAVLQWFAQKSDGDFGTAIIVPEKHLPVFAEDKSNLLLLATVRPAMPLRYLIGAAWSKATGIRSMKDWREFAATAAARERSPVIVTWSPAAPK